MNNKRGYFGIGIYNPKTNENIGTLWRSANIFGASFIFTIGNRYKHQPGDTTKAFKHIPLYFYETFEDFYRNIPLNCRLVGIEIDEKSRKLETYIHPEQVVYLLGREDSGLPKDIIDKCNDVVVLPGNICLNVSVAGSITMYDRIMKNSK